MKSNAIVSTQYTVSGKRIDCFFYADFSFVEEKLQKNSTVIITDENVFNTHSAKFAGWKTIVIKAGEKHKNQATVDSIIEQLIQLHADRQTFIVGVGGGVVTDVAGFVASVYMRGVRFAFVPTTILAMVDAAIGGKNGIDVGVYKNIAGTIRQPEFLLFDYTFLETLPQSEWANGFAEIIKHACIRDKEMVTVLKNNSIERFQSSPAEINELIKKNVDIKYTIVEKDEYETGDRKLLNFGHTIGHAIENISKLPHGHAISIGMMAACRISEIINGFSSEESNEVRHLLQQYYLPTELSFDKEKVWQILLHDKKKSGSNMNFVVLDSIGAASVKSISLEHLHKIFNNLF